MTLRDDVGRIVNINLPVRRIISLAPVATENLFAIGAGSLVVGVSNADDYPAPAKKLPRVGDLGLPIAEKIIVLRPDLIVVDTGTVTRQAMEELAARFHAPVFAQKSTTFDDVPRHLLQFGMLTNHQKEAAHVAHVMQNKAAQVAKRVAGKPRVTVFVEVSREPLYAAGPGSFIDDLIRRAGGTNIVRGNNPYPVYPRELLLAANPQHYIVTVGSDMNPGRVRDATTLPSPFNTLRAARSGNVHALPADLLVRSTPRLADGLLLLAKALHP